MRPLLRRFLWLHALITFAAGVVLIARPGLIPAAVGIALDPGANLICYLLGACEISLAALSYYATRLRDRRALRLICLTFIILHGTTAVVEMLAYTQGLSAGIWWNVALRVAVIGLFIQLGLRRDLPR